MTHKIKGEIPNTITCLNLLCGCMAVISAFGTGSSYGIESYQWAFIFIGLASIFDFCAGAMARRIHAYSPLGKELDSLSDLVSFGLAPAMLLYVTIGSLSSIHWMPYTALAIAICGGIRLARFNVDTRQTTEFIGLPIPANAIFWVGAIAFMHSYGYPSDWIVAGAIALMSWLMLAPMRIFSLKFKNFALRPNIMRYAILAAAIISVAVFGLPGFSLAILLYILAAAIYNLISRKD
ncbi:MAG: CDP-diacylglycerol--serine O-phosphatidyltransferase [Muribaculaceae bacterium]|nr:CDP-diacylglycerol--serine O-phosphatidyltransferase [Muribaculaceae bacterium]